MRVEHTSQLIQLILNSVLLLTACTMVLGGALARHEALVDRLRSLQHDRLAAASLQERSRSIEQHSLMQLKLQLHPLRRHYRLTHASVLAALYALLCCLSSALSVSCRMLINWNGFIPIALVLFVATLALLLLSLGLTLLDVHADQRSLRQELLGLSSEPSPLRFNLYPLQPQRRSKASRRMLQKISSKVKAKFQ